MDLLGRQRWFHGLQDVREVVMMNPPRRQTVHREGVQTRLQTEQEPISGDKRLNVRRFLLRNCNQVGGKSSRKTQTLILLPLDPGCSRIL